MRRTQVHHHIQLQSDSHHLNILSLSSLLILRHHVRGKMDDDGEDYVIRIESKPLVRR